MEPRGVDVEKTGLVGSESGAELRGIALAERADRLADLGRERRDVDERLHVGAAGRGLCDDRAAVGVPDEDDRAGLRVNHALGRFHIGGK